MLCAISSQFAHLLDSISPVELGGGPHADDCSHQVENVLVTLNFSSFTRVQLIKCYLTPEIINDVCLDAAAWMTSLALDDCKPSNLTVITPANTLIQSFSSLLSIESLNI